MAKDKPTKDRTKEDSRGATWSVGNLLLLALFAITAVIIIGVFVVTNGVFVFGVSKGIDVTKGFQSDIDKAANAPPNSAERTRGIKARNYYVFVRNTILTFIHMAIIAWNYLQLVILWLYQILVSIIVQLWLAIIGNPSLRDAAMRIMYWAAEAAQIVVKVVGEVGDQPEAFESEGSTAFGAGSGSADPKDPNTTGHQRWVKITQVIVRAIAKFLTGIGPKIIKWVEWLINVIAKNGRELYKVFVNLSNFFDSAGFGGKFIDDSISFLFDLGKYLNGGCIQAYLQNQAACLTQDSIGEIFNKIRSGLKSLGVGGIPKYPKCGKGNQISNKCGGSTSSRSSIDWKELARVSGENNGTLPEFGAGLCDETECFFDVVEAITLLSYRGGSCAYWTNPATNATLDCMVFIRDYSLINSTNAAEAPIETIAPEICIVMRGYILDQCDASQPPFSFNFEDLADDVCIGDKSGFPTPFSEACACEYEDPMCDATCCEQYTTHVHNQVVDSIGTRQCSVATALYPENTVWCPLEGSTAQTVPFLSDYTFTHVWCSWAQQIFFPRCNADPFSTVAAAVNSGTIAGYLSSTCAATVAGIGVCVPINTDIAEFTYAMLDALGDVDVDDLYDQNRLATFTPTPITTIPSGASTPAQIIEMTVAKYYCQQFSIVHNNTNGMFASRPWSVQSVVGRYCDASIGIALTVIDVSPDAMYKLRDEAGNLVQEPLFGVPVGTPAFGTAVGSNECAPSTGLSQIELADHQSCTALIQVGLMEETIEIGANGDMGMFLLGETALRSDTFDFTADRADPLDPSDPQFARKSQEIDETDALEGQNRDWSITPAEDQVNDTHFFRGEIPDAAEGDQKNPVDGLTGPYTGSRTLQSIIESEPSPLRRQNKNWNGPVLHAGGDRAILRWGDWSSDGADDSFGDWSEVLDPEEEEDYADLESSIQGLANLIRTHISDRFWPDNAHPQSLRKLLEARAKRRTQRRMHNLFTNVLIPLGDRIREREETEADLERRVNEAARESFSSGRGLKSTGDSEFDARVEAVVFDLQRRPGTPPGGLTDSEFEEVQAKDAQDILNDLSDASMSIIVPRIWAMFYSAVTNGTLPSFGAGASGPGDPDCLATKDNPVKCCGADTSSYRCCEWSFTCIKEPKDSYYANYSTRESFPEDVDCPKYDTFIEYWFNFFHLFVSVVLRVVFGFLGKFGETFLNAIDFLLLDYDSVNSKTFDCFVYNVTWALIGLLILALFYMLSASQMATEVAIFYQGTAEAEEVETKISAVENDISLLDERIRAIEEDPTTTIRRQVTRFDG